MLWTEEVEEDEEVLVLVGVCGGVYGGAGWEWECRCLPWEDMLLLWEDVLLWLLWLLWLLCCLMVRASFLGGPPAFTTSSWSLLRLRVL